MDISPKILEAAALLDKDNPGWHRRVNLDDFNINDGCKCVLGWAYGDGIRRAGSGYGNHHERLEDILNIPGIFSWMPYESEWRHFIAERQKADDFPLSFPIEVTEEVYA